MIKDIDEFEEETVICENCGCEVDVLEITDDLCEDCYEEWWNDYVEDKCWYED